MIKFCYYGSNNVVLLYVASPSSQLSNGAALAIVAVICSTVFLILGTVFGSLCVYCVPKCKQLYNSKLSIVVNFLYHSNQFQIMKLFITQHIH